MLGRPAVGEHLVNARIVGMRSQQDLAEVEVAASMSLETPGKRSPNWPKLPSVGRV